MVQLAGVCHALGDGAVDLASLEALTGRWIALRAELAEERQSWERQERHWQRELALLEQEIASRRDMLDADSTYLDDVERAQARLLAERDAAESALQALGSQLARHEMHLRAFAPLVPQSLLGELGTGFRALPANDAAAARAGVLRRLQTVLALYTQIESLQNNIHAVQELITLNGQQREVDVVYIGLARGFAVSGGDDWAAIGEPTVAGWQWQEMSAEAGRIRRAIRVLQREGDIQLIPLLWGMSGEVRP